MSEFESLLERTCRAWAALRRAGTPIEIESARARYLKERGGLEAWISAKDARIAELEKERDELEPETLLCEHWEEQ